MGYGDKPFGLREIRLVSAAGEIVHLPAAMKLGFALAVVFNELRQDDLLRAIVTVEDRIDWSLEAGGISLAAWALMTGYSVAESGTAPSRASRLRLMGNHTYPFFRIYGKSVGDNLLDDIHVKLHKCKLAEPLEGEFADGEFYVTKCAGKSVAHPLYGLADIVQNETSAAETTGYLLAESGEILQTENGLPLQVEA
jgi:hypothetical protein